MRLARIAHIGPGLFIDHAPHSGGAFDGNLILYRLAIGAQLCPHLVKPGQIDIEAHAAPREHISASVR